VVDNGALLSRAAPALDFSPPTCSSTFTSKNRRTLISVRMRIK
jgi:hypothetical protein